MDSFASKLAYIFDPFAQILTRENDILRYHTYDVYDIFLFSQELGGAVSVSSSNTPPGKSRRETLHCVYRTQQQMD